MQYRNRGGRIIDWLTPEEAKVMLRKGEIFPVETEDRPPATPDVSLPKKPETPDVPKKPDSVGLPLTIEEARSKYEEKYDKPVPNAFKNKLDWITSKL